MMTPHQLDIAQWLTDLAIRCPPRTAENIETMARDYATSLDDLPRELFNEQLRNAASMHFDRFPTYKQLRTWLEKWWSANKPKPRLIASEAENSGLTEEQKIQATYWFRHKAQSFKHLAERFPNIADRQAQSLDLLRRHNEPVFRYICHVDTEAAAIAVQRRWRVDPEPEVTEEERAAAKEAAGIATDAYPTNRKRPDYAAIDKQAAERDQSVRDAQVAKYRSGSADARAAAAIRPETGSSPPPETPRTSDMPPPANDTDRWVPDWEGADA